MRHSSPDTARQAWDAARDVTAVQPVRSWKGISLEQNDGRPGAALLDIRDSEPHGTIVARSERSLSARDGSRAGGGSPGVRSECVS
jgi:hypothetical protein